MGDTMANARVRLATLAAIVAASLGGGCETTSSQTGFAAARQARDESADKCARIYPVGATRAECINAADNLYMRPFQRYPDLFDVLLADRLSIETRQQQGQITAADGQLEWAKTASWVQSTGLARDNQQAATMAGSMPVTCTSNSTSTTCY
jgi:hypothetical protein